MKGREFFVTVLVTIVAVTIFLVAIIIAATREDGRNIHNRQVVQLACVNNGGSWAAGVCFQNGQVAGQ